METINFTEARNSLKEVLDRVEEDQDFTVITRRDAGDAVVMSFSVYNELIETVHLLSSPANAIHLGASITEYRQGKAVSHPLVEE